MALCHFSTNKSKSIGQFLEFISDSPVCISKRISRVATRRNCWCPRSEPPPNVTLPKWHQCIAMAATVKFKLELKAWKFCQKWHWAPWHWVGTLGKLKYAVLFSIFATYHISTFNTLRKIQKKYKIIWFTFNISINLLHKPRPGSEWEKCWKVD